MSLDRTDRTDWIGTIAFGRAEHIAHRQYDRAGSGSQS
jgi:hypothetical protein